MTPEAIRELQPSRAVGRRRLLQLAELLEGLKEEQFDYSIWAGGGWDSTIQLGTCGTTACALGWATALPEAQEAGLILTDCRFSRVSLRGQELNPDVDCLDAAQVVFSLSRAEARYLFMPSGADDESPPPRVEGVDWKSLPDSPPDGASAVTVAAHIRQFVHHYMKEAQS